MTNLEQAVGSIGAESTTDMNKRQHIRHLCVEGGVVRLSVRPEFRGRRALLVDVSTGGIGLLMEDELEAGTMLVFELKTPPGMPSISRIARVRHSRPQPTPSDAPWLEKTPAVSKIFRRLLGMKPPAPPRDSWLVGCEFDRPLEANEISQFLAILEAEFKEEK